MKNADPTFLEKLEATLPPLMTIAQVAELIQVAEVTVERWLAAGKLKRIDVVVGRRVRIPRDSVIAALRERSSVDARGDEEAGE